MVVPPVPAMAIRRSIRRFSVPGLYNRKSWAVFVRSSSTISGKTLGTGVLAADGTAAGPCMRAFRASFIRATGSIRSARPVWIAALGMPS